MNQPSEDFLDVAAFGSDADRRMIEKRRNPFVPEYTDDELRKYRDHNASPFIERAVAAKRAAIAKLPDRTNMPWWSQAAAFGRGENTITGDEWRELSALAAHGQWLVMSGAMLDGEPQEYLQYFTKDNGMYDRDPRRCARYLANGTEHGRKSYDPTKITYGRDRINSGVSIRGVSISTCSTPQPTDGGARDVGTSVTSHRYDHLAEHIAAEGLSLLELGLAYTIAAYGLLHGLSIVKLSQRVLADALGWTQPRVAERVPVIVKAGVFGRDPGERGRRTQVFYLDLDRFPVSPVESPTVDLRKYLPLAHGCDSSIARRKAKRKTVQREHVKTPDFDVMTMDEQFRYLTRDVS